MYVGRLTLAFNVKCSLSIFKHALIEYSAGFTFAIVTPICDLSRTIAAQCFYCSQNALLFRDLYLRPVPSCCARTLSITINLIMFKVRYCLRIRAEPCLHPRCEHVWYASSTNQRKCLVDFGRWNFAMAKHLGSARMRDTLCCVLLAAVSKHRNSTYIAGQIMGLKPDNRYIAMRNSTHSIWIKASQKCLLHVIPKNVQKWIGS